MGLLDVVKDMLVPDTEPGIAFECMEGGERFDEARDTCPNCGSTEMKEVEGFEMRPSA